MTEDFVDYYELMQISPNAERETIQRVYRMLVARYHPDNPQTGDMERFLLLNRAYQVLSDAAPRTEYDAEYEVRAMEPIEVFNLKEFAFGIDGEANRRTGVLCLLYNRRRVKPEESGLSLLDLEKLMSMAREHLTFTIWYLRERGFVRQEENSDFVITAVGVDQVESSLPRNQHFYKLLKAAEIGSPREGSAENN